MKCIVGLNVVILEVVRISIKIDNITYTRYGEDICHYLDTIGVSRVGILQVCGVV